VNRPQRLTLIFLAGWLLGGAWIWILTGHRDTSADSAICVFTIGLLIVLRGGGK
jgi:hypothetical protein